MTSPADLSAKDLELLNRLVGRHPHFRLYLADGLQSARSGQTNRFVRIGQAREGAALGVAFDRLEVWTLVGRLTFSEERDLTRTQTDGELHVEPSEADRIWDFLGARGGARQGLRYYLLEDRPVMAPDLRCRLLGEADRAAITELFHAHRPTGAMSGWMLDQPFLGVFEHGILTACGGVITMADGVANIGNFITIPSERGKGLARAVAASLGHLLFDRGVQAITLTTTDENSPAWRAYEAAGFRCYDRREQLNFAAP
jgi:ribosomal protein S18 acetylase RimI-like enzyme